MLVLRSSERDNDVVMPVIIERVPSTVSTKPKTGIDKRCLLERCA
jgi:hypothetical protein